MILAAAIKYHITATGRDVVLCGARHGNIFEQLEQLGFGPRFGYEELEQGFIDHRGVFLTRAEAYDHAVMCGQIPEKIIYEREKSGSKQLISEDLW